MASSGSGCDVVLDSSSSADHSRVRTFMSTKQLRDECFFHKAILSSSPLYCKSSYVILIYNNKSKIAFWKQGETAWNSLDDVRGQGYYCDAIYSNANKNGRVYALSFSPSTPVLFGAWDFDQRVPLKLMQNKPPLPEKGEI